MENWFPAFAGMTLGGVGSMPTTKPSLTPNA